MKIRTGFISNSSTSSFCIYGIYAHIEDLNVSESENIDKLIDSLTTQYNIKNLFIIEDPDPDSTGYLYIGKQWQSIKDEETGRDFKLSIQNEILKMFPNYKGEFKTYEEAWMDN